MKRVLFVCLGNICRSPAGEGIFKKMLTDEGLDQKISVDSAGTAAYHVGELPDSRMRAQGKKRGYDFSTHARQFDPLSDFENFDLILAMDHSNFRNIVQTAEDQESEVKVKLFCELCENHDVEEVPDPYYEGIDGFDVVLDILEDGCRTLISQIKV